MKARHLALLLVVTSSHSVRAAGTQIGDFRIGSTTYPSLTYFDPGFSETTRATVGAPVQVNSAFTGTSQDAGDAPANSAEDIGLQTFSSATVIRQLNRFASDPDGPGAAGGPQTVGAVQWSFDLSPIDSYLSTNSLELTALDLDLVTSLSSTALDKEYDIYLSYTNLAESISRTSIHTSSAASNYSTFWFPAQAAAEGAVVNNSFKLIELDFIGNMNLTIDLLSLYDAGVREFNLIMSSGAFFSGRTIGIGDGSGLSIDTAPVPEPSAAVLGLLGGLALVRRRR